LPDSEPYLPLLLLLLPPPQLLLLLQVDLILSRLQVLARSSPEDKYLLVTRLNGVHLPMNKEEWEKKHPRHDWATERQRLLPGYYEVRRGKARE